MSDSRSVSVFLRANVAGYVAAIEQAKLKTADFAKSAEKSATQHRQSWDKVGKGMLITGGILAVGVGLAVKAFADFDKSMSNVRAVSGANAKQMDLLGKAAIKAGADTVFSATDAAKAEAELAKAGVSTSDILGGALLGSLNLASAGGLDLADASTIAAQTMNIFGLKGQDVSHIADVLASGANKSAADVKGLGDSLRMGGLVAAQTGLTLEDTVGTLSMFADAALTGSDGGTSLKQMLMMLNPQSEKAKTAMERIGFSAYDATGKFVGMESVAQQLKDGLGGLTEKQRAATLTTIFGSDATRAASILMKEGAAGVREYTTAVNDNGAAQRMASVQLNNMSGDLEQLKGSIDTALIQSGSAANGVLRTLLQGATGTVNAFGGLPPTLQKGALGLGAVTSAGLLAGGAFLVVVPKIAATKVALTELGIASKLTRASMMSFATGPIGIALAGITLAVGLFAKSQMDAKGRADDLRNSLDQETGAITNQTRALVAKQLQEDGAFERATRLGVSVKVLTDAALGQGNAIQYLKDKQAAQQAVVARTITQTTDETAKRGLLLGTYNAFAPAAAKVTAGASGQAKEFGALLQSVVPINNVLAGQTSQQKQIATAVGTTTGAAKGLTLAEVDQKKAADADKAAHDALTASIVGYGSALAAARGDARSYEAAVDAASAAVKKNGKTLDITTEKGRDNQAALDAISTSALAAATSNIKNAEANGTLSRATGKVTGDVGRARAAFIASAMSMGMTRAEAGRLATQSGLTAARVQGITKELIGVGKQHPKPKVTVDAKKAHAELKAVQEEATNLRGKTITIGVNARFTSIGANYTQAASHNQGARAAFAKGGAVKGNIKGVDSVPAMLMPEEFVVDRTGSNLGEAMAHFGVRGMAKGGFVTNAPILPPPLASRMNSGFDSLVAGVDLQKLMVGAMGGGAGAGGGAARWSSVVLSVLAMLGQSPGNLGAVLRLINKESGGNPRAINLWDSNAKAGTPSMGLIQTIMPTFLANAGPFAMLGPYNPTANVYAGLRHAISAWGSIAAVDPLRHAGGYDTGGMMPPGGVGANYGKLPERVLSGHQTESFDRLVALLSSGAARGGGGGTVTATSRTIILQVDGREMTRVVLDGMDRTLSGGLTAGVG